MKTISKAENYNSSTSRALENISNGLSFLADHEDLKVQRLEEKVIQDLLQYAIACQNAKEEFKSQFNLRDRELSKRKQLEVSPKPNNENEVILSNMQISKILKEISVIAETFEEQKNRDVQELLSNFVLIQMKYHASCLEVLTMMHEDVAAIDEKKDTAVSRF